MSTGVHEFNDTKRKIDGKLSNVEQLEKEIKRLTSITQGLKKSDFELTNLKKNTAKSDAEKIELHRKLDSLQRLVAKMRRHRN